MIPEFLWHGAEAYGFRGEAWTAGDLGVPCGAVCLPR